MSTPTLVKKPAESRNYTMDFASNMSAGETVVQVISWVAIPTGLTFPGVPTFSGTKAFNRISGGVSGEVYTVTVRVLTSGGNTLEGDGYLRVTDNP